jgi:biotin operon repressor
MKFFEYIELLQRLDRLIRLKATGTPQNLGEKLKMSERQARRIIDEMKGQGLPISYCKQHQSYYYESEVFMKFEIVAVMGDERKKIVGGEKKDSNFLDIFFTRTFFDRDTDHLCTKH